MWARIILGILLLPSVVWGQNIQFNHLTTDDGLSTGNIRGVLQDYQGIFWFGSEDGLMRYDGYEITAYKYDENDLRSISSNFLLTLFEDSYNHLWIGTLDGGICLYDRERDNFIRYMHDPDNPSSLGYNYVRAFFETEDKELVIGFENSNFSIVQLTENISEELQFENLTIPVNYDKSNSNWGSSLIMGPKGNLLIGVNGGGIYEFDLRKKTFLPFVMNDQLTGGVQKLCLASDDKLWIGTWRKGLFVYDYATEELANFTTESKAPILDNQTEAIVEDQKGNIWIGTDKGLHVIDFDQDPFNNMKIRYVQHSQRDESSLLTNSIKDLHVDSDNRIWVSSYYGGINVYDESAYKFNPIKSTYFERDGLSFDNVVAFQEDGRGNLWIGTDGGGVNFVSGGTSKLWASAYQSIPELKKANKVKCLEMDREGTLFIGTWGQGMFEWNPVTRKAKQYLAGNGPTDISANEVLSIKVDSKNNLWIGTFSGGLNYLDRRTGLIKRYPKLLDLEEREESDKINLLFIDGKERLWVCPEVGGLCLYDASQDQFKLIKNEIFDESTTILSMIEDEDHSFWLGTHKLGLIHFDPKSEKVTKYDDNNGLSNNVVRALIQDRNGKVWVGSNKGLSVLDPTTEKIINYGSSNGVQGNEFNTAFVASDGTALFGGLKGMNAFVPEHIVPNQESPGIVFTKFWVNNEEVSILDEDTPLKRNILLANEIELTYEQRSFSIGYAALSYTFEDRKEYSYKLDGFHDDWQFVGTERKATFTNLPPNNYIFRVKSSNSDGFWGDNEQVLAVTVLPAWWQTIWFRLGMVLALVSAVLGFIRYRTYSLERTRIELEELVQERTQEVQNLNSNLEQSNIELKEQKDNLEETVTELKSTRNQLAVSEKMASLGIFTAGIAHEINNPVNFIAGANQKLIDLIERKEREEGDSRDVVILKELAHIMNVGIERTVQIVNSLRNYSRNQPGKFENYNIIHCVEDSLLILAHKIKNSSIEVKKNYPERLYVDCLPGRISQIFINLISNAVDAIDGGGTIQLDLSYNSDKVIIEIADDGVGIDDEDLSKLFDPFYSTKEVGQGSGLGLYIVYGIVAEHDGTIEVEPKKPGTKFKISLPKNQKNQHAKSTDKEVLGADAS